MTERSLPIVYVNNVWFKVNGKISRAALEKKANLTVIGLSINTPSLKVLFIINKNKTERRPLQFQIFHNISVSNLNQQTDITIFLIQIVHDQC